MDVRLVAKLLFLGLFSGIVNALCSNGDCKLHDICHSNDDCASGLHCETCIAAGYILPRCTRIQPTNAIYKREGRPFNKYAWLTTHNSFAVFGERSSTGAPRVIFSNQQDSVTDQLKNGVRGFMLDMYNFRGDVWLCHSLNGTCYGFTAFEPAINTLKEIQAFLASSPKEIVTIFIEDYVHEPNKLTKLFANSGLKKYWFPVSKMPKNGEDWPSVTEMITKNERLVVFTSKQYKEATEGIAYQWRYVVENQYGNEGMKPQTCKNRAESPALNVKSRALVLLNHFPDNPNFPKACKHNSASLSNMLDVCFTAAGNRWPNFLAVDFYKRSDGGGAAGAVDTLNGRFLCGRDDIALCNDAS